MTAPEDGQSAAPTLADDERALLHVAAAGGPLAEPLARMLAEYGQRGARIRELETRLANLQASVPHAVSPTAMPYEPAPPSGPIADWW